MTAPQPAPGQAAAEVWHARRFADGRIVRIEDAYKYAHPDWDAVAEAAISASGLREEAASLRGQLAKLSDDYEDLHERLASWPQCPDGCGCDLATGDADAQECGCEGPCTMECRENGYPDAPSYRDLAVSRVKEERDRLRIAAAGRDRALDDLASRWEHGDNNPCPVECARELRAALEGGVDG